MPALRNGASHLGPVAAAANWVNFSTTSSVPLFAFGVIFRIILIINQTDTLPFLQHMRNSKPLCFWVHSVFSSFALGTGVPRPFTLTARAPRIVHRFSAGEHTRPGCGGTRL